MRRVPSTPSESHEGSPLVGVPAVSVRSPLFHRCPFREERDEGALWAEWTGFVELWEFRSWLNSWSDKAISHEALTALIADYLKRTASCVRVQTNWTTGGFDVTVVSPAT